MTQQYFYDKQIRRYIQQFIRLFSGFTVQMGVNDDKLPTFLEVPVRYGDINRMAAHIQRENSENIINTVPFISCYVTDFSMAPERRVSPEHVDKVQVYEKKQDISTGEYLDEVGNTYTIERHMPVPYNITMNCDIWTSNTDQKLQLIEQIMVLFNPTLNVRTSSNPYDWSALAYVEMTNSIWSSRSVGSSVDDIIDVSTLTFQMPAFINPPAKVKQQRIIHTILNQLYNLDDDDLDAFRNNEPFNTSTLEYIIVTLENRKVKYLDGKAYILSESGNDLDSNGDQLIWSEVLKPFGALREGISQIRLRKNSDPGDTSDDVIGRLSIDDTNPNALLVDIDTDTLPANTLGPITGILNPLVNFPGDGIIDPVQTGQRYLIIEDTAGAWGSVVAKANDIIEYNGADWIVSFDSSTSSSQYMINLSTNDQFAWDGTQWTNSHEGIYNEGFWRLYL